MKIGVHVGRALLAFADLYSSIPEVIRELVQNSLDEKAKRIYIVIDPKRKRLLCYDDGEGASKEEIEKKFALMAKSLKTEDKRGERGIGLVSPLGIAEVMEMITSPGGHGEQYFKIRLERQKLKEEENPQLLFGRGEIPRHKNRRFTTLVVARQLQIKEKYLQRYIEEAIELLQETFGEALKETKIWINEKEVPFREFPGKIIFKERIYESDGKVIEAEIWATLRPEKPGILLNYKGKYDLPLKKIKELKNLEINSGYFHGRIKINFGEIAPRRNDLVKDEDRELVLEVIEKFNKEFIAPYLREQIIETQKNEKVLRILNGALKEIESRIKIEDLPTAFKGAVSKSHFKAKKKPVKGLENGIKRLLEKKKAEKKMEEEKRRAEKKLPPLHHQKNRQHGGVKGGERKNRLKGEKGIVIYPHPMERDRRRAFLESGVVHINTAHPKWVEISDKNEIEAIKYTTNLIASVLIVERLKEENAWRQDHKIAAKAFEEFFTILF